jgi:hypothetical protein
MAYGWLTPGYPPARRFYTRQLLIPATAEFLALVNGALIELCKVYNWEQDGEMTPAETAEYFLDMWQAYTKNVNEPPDWTNSEDVDGEPEQPWYDELADWIITGFLAVTFHGFVWLSGPAILARSFACLSMELRSGPAIVILPSPT